MMLEGSHEDAFITASHLRRVGSGIAYCRNVCLWPFADRIQQHLTASTQFTSSIAAVGREDTGIGFLQRTSTATTTPDLLFYMAA